jgi:hypothetical protein
MSVEDVDLMHVVARDAEGGVVAADGFFVGAFEQALDLAFGVVVKLGPRRHSLIRGGSAGRVEQNADRQRGQLLDGLVDGRQNGRGHQRRRGVVEADQSDVVGGATPTPARSSRSRIRRGG